MTWSYDSAFRRTREQRSGTNAYDLTYTWDGAGNRLTKLASGTTTTYTYNAGDALTLENAAGTLTTYAYDSAGNTSTQNAAGSVTTYTWDDENRMTGLVLPSGGGTWTMAYNPNGLRREKQAAGTTTRFVWDGQRLLQETDGSNATTAHYTAGLGAYGPTVSQRRSSTSGFLHGSLLGTIESLTAADQSTSDTYVLDAWGSEIAATGSTTNPHRYIGRLGYYTEPSLSLDYVRARWLRPGTGSWVSPDPVATEPKYLYAGRSPVIRSDASGRYDVYPAGLDGPPREGVDSPIGSPTAPYGSPAEAEPGWWQWIGESFTEVFWTDPASQWQPGDSIWPSFHDSYACFRRCSATIMPVSTVVKWAVKAWSLTTVIASSPMYGCGDMTRPKICGVKLPWSAPVTWTRILYEYPSAAAGALPAGAVAVVNLEPIAVILGGWGWGSTVGCAAACLTNPTAY